MAESMKEKFKIPVPEFFLCRNYFSGSTGEFNYKIIPEDAVLKTYIWYGKNCIDKSEIAHEAEFPLTDEDRTGYESMCQWINEIYLNKL